MEVVGVFRELDRAAEAVEALLRAQVPEETITSLTHVPYPDGVLIREKDTRNRLPWYALAGGLSGALSGFALAAGTAWLYPLHTGDKPIISLFPVGIITYELTMMLAIVGTVLGMFIEMRLPGYLNRVQAPEITEGMIGIAVTCPTLDACEPVRDVLIGAGAEKVRIGGQKEE